MSIRRFNLITDDEAAKRANRNYMKSHRDEWSSFGFRSMTYMIHDSERDLVAADLDVRRCNKLIELAEARDTDAAVLLSLSRRNMPKPPDEGTIAALREAASGSTADKAVTAELDIAVHTQKKHKGLVALFAKTDDRTKRIRVAARGVAYSSAVVARYRLAQALLDYAPLKPRSVFGVEGSAATIAETDWEDENG